MNTGLVLGLFAVAATTGILTDSYSGAASYKPE